jgi:hypothetical protein
MTLGQPSQEQPLAPRLQQQLLEVPLKIVGGNKYGRYKKVSAEQTFNMMISDEALVDYAGYQNVLSLTNNPRAEGRGAYASTVSNLMVIVVDNAVFTVTVKGTNPLTAIYESSFRGTLATSSGEVYIAENNNNQVALSDGVHIYILNTLSFSFQIAQTATNTPLDFIPGFLSFQNSRFICAAIGEATWRLSNLSDGLIWPDDSSHVGLLQTKPDTVQAAVPMPGRGNTLFLFGTTVGEQWNDTGAALFPYLRQSSFNLDYGCINPSSIAYQGNYIVWIGVSEEAGPVVMYTTGGDIKEVSTDGIDYLFSTLQSPEDCSGFLVKIDGHLFYQFTFKSDNVSLILDLDTQTFFTVTDENLNYHIARKIVYFDNNYYFVSFNDGNLYAFGTSYTDYVYSLPNATTPNIAAIPRIRYCPPIRFPTQRPYIVKSISFTIEQGQENTPPLNMAVDLSISRDGAETFSSQYRQYMNPTGLRKSRFIFQRCGRANDLTVQLQFWGFNRFVVFDGIAEIYQ